MIDNPKQYMITYTISEMGWFGSEEQARSYARDFAPVHSSETMDIDVEEMSGR